MEHGSADSSEALKQKIIWLVLSHKLQVFVKFGIRFSWKQILKM